MNYAESLEELNTTLDDTENVTFTPEQKERALQKAWNDSFVVKTVYDSTLSFASTTYDYAIPGTVTTITDILMSPSGSNTSALTTIDTNAYSVSGGFIRFRNNASFYTTSGFGFTVKGNYKLQWQSDSLDTTDLQEYVIALAGYNTIQALLYKKANLFLKNDVTVAELISMKRDFDTDVRRLRGNLQRSFESA